MTDQVGMMGQGAAMAVLPAVAEAARPRIGADRFRALADRLKKPSTIPALDTAPVVTLPSIAPSPPPEPVAAPVPTPLPVPAELPVPEFIPEAAPAPSEPPPPAHIPQFRAAAFEPPVVIVQEPVVAQVFQQPLSPIERVLISERAPVASGFKLPEILPPPPPPPPPLLIEENGTQVQLEAPTMELVQERLRGDATVRLQQLDIDNIWRQVLAQPTLEERADYLREAAEIMAAELGIDPATIAVAPEYDLSRIEVPGIENSSAAMDENAPPTVRQQNETVTHRLDDANEGQLETAELARSLLDMMSSGSASGLPHERALAADTLLRLLPKLALKSLQMLAQRLAMMDNPPQLLAAKLIRDERVEVSGPLLEDSMHITDQDLAVVVAENNPGKRRMIARRRKISRAISDKLIATRDPSVLLTLVRNANAEISHDGFIALTEAAADMPDLMAPLSTRADLSATNAFELFWAAPPQLRRYLLNRFLTDSETLTKILKITLSTKDGDDTRETEMPSAGEITELLDMACRGRTETASQRLGEAINVDPETVHRILLDRAGEAMVVLLKTAGYPRSSVGDLLPALKRGEIPLIDSEREVSELQTMFDTLSTNKARILITYWDWAVRKSGPYAPVH